MNASRRTRTARAAFLLAGALALLPRGERAPAFPNPKLQRTAGDAEGLFFPGNPVILTDQRALGTDRAWMEFKTDPCGTLLRVESGRSLVSPSGFTDEFDEFGDNDADPSDIGRDMVEGWLSEHAEITVINDGVDKGCDGGWFDGEERPGDLQARRILEHRQRWRQRINESEIA
ncbi:MAG TPA: hypothetical protein VHE36_14250 [Sphingomicrobium sp.]|nr:hypothetical protein [Sphingomicrobium sp.]